MPTNTEGDKTKLFSMAEGYGDIVTNDRRMTVEKRGNPAGVVAWRFISHGDQIETVGPERRRVEFDPNQSYFWEASWRSNRFNVLVREAASTDTRFTTSARGSRAAPTIRVRTSFTSAPRSAGAGPAARRSIKRSSGRCGCPAGRVRGSPIASARCVWIAPVRLFVGLTGARPPAVEEAG